MYSLYLFKNNFKNKIKNTNIKKAELRPKFRVSLKKSDDVPSMFLFLPYEGCTDGFSTCKHTQLYVSEKVINKTPTVIKPL